MLAHRRIRVLRLATHVLATIAALALIHPPAAAQVEWRSGERSAPLQMQPGELAQAAQTLAGRPGLRRVVLHFDAPLSLERRAELERDGVRLLSYLGGYAYFATLTSDLDAPRFATVPGTVAIEAIDPHNKLHPDLAAGIARPWSVVVPADEVRGAIVAVTILFHRDFDMEAGAAELLKQFGGTVQSSVQSIHGVVAHLSIDRVDALAAADEVMYVEPPLPLLEELNDGNRVRTGANSLNSPPYGLDGSGVTVMVYDGGQVLAHDDLAGRLTIGTSDTAGISDHSTHVACTIGGNDGGGNLSGMAPGVDIVSYAFEQAGGLTQGFLYTDPGDLEADYGEAISLHGADLANNSIGTNTAPNGFPCSWEGNYGATGALIDEVVRGSLGDPFRVVWANGNERGSGACGTAYLTTAPPACAKNHITVGAMNSNDDSVTSFTSWGPCDDGRLKPDISAPGCQSGGDGGVSSCSSSGGYTVKCGTSMAAPTAAGVSALLLQHYRETFPTRPDFRNSMLKAILAQTAVDLENPGPDYKTGYGSIRAQPAADLISAGKLVEDEVAQQEIHTFTMTVGSGTDVKVTLAWDDPAGTPDVNPVLVNDLDLRIIGPGEIVHLPWTLNPADPAAPAVRNARDGVNNIEQVFLENPGPGSYRVEIEGFNVADGPTQPFSVATSHAPVFCAVAPTFSGVATVTPGSSCGEIELDWSAGQSNCEGQIRYNVYRGTIPFFLPVASTSVQQGVTGTSFTDFGLEPEATYYYIVRADDSISGEDSNGVRRFAVPPSSPDISAPIFSGLQSAVAGPSCGEVLLAWPDALESCSGPVTYEIHRSTDPGFLPGAGTLVATTFGTGFVDTSVEPGAAQTYLVRAKDALGNQDANDARLTTAPAVFDVELFQTGFEPDNAGWSVVAPNDATTGNWEWGDPSGTNWQPEDDATLLGVNCWITGLSPNPGNGDVDSGTTTLLSAAYDISTAVNPTVQYSRWFTNDRGGSSGDATDSFRVDVSDDDGQNWAPLEEVGAGTPLAWVPVSFALPGGGTSQLRFRFTAADLGQGTLVEAGIDDFAIVDGGQACEQCGPPAQSLCSISLDRSGDDVLVDWSTNPVGTRAVIYHVTGCDASDRIRLGTSESNVFVHEDAALSTAAFQYRVTFVDACGDEQAFCGANDCP